MMSDIATTAKDNGVKKIRKDQKKPGSYTIRKKDPVKKGRVIIHSPKP
jgi:hypothetical protein